MEPTHSPTIDLLTGATTRNKFKSYANRPELRPILLIIGRPFVIDIPGRIGDDFHVNQNG